MKMRSDESTVRAWVDCLGARQAIHVRLFEVGEKTTLMDDFAHDWLIMHAELVAARKVIEAIREAHDSAPISWACATCDALVDYDAVVKT